MKICQLTFVFLLLLFFIIIALVVNGCPINTGAGEHIGIVNSIKKSGLLINSNIVYIKSSAYASSISSYCVLDKRIYNDLYDIADQQKNISFTFSEVFAGGMRCNGITQIITGFKILN